MALGKAMAYKKTILLKGNQLGLTDMDGEGAKKLYPHGALKEQKVYRF